MPTQTFPTTTIVTTQIERTLKTELNSVALSLLNAWFVQSKTGANQALRNQKNSDVQIAAIVGNLMWAVAVFTPTSIAAGAILSFTGVAIGSAGSLKPQPSGDILTIIERNLASLKSRFKIDKLVEEATWQLVNQKGLISNDAVAREKRRRGMWAMMFNIPYGDVNIQDKARVSASKAIEVANRLYFSWQRSRQICMTGPEAILQCYPTGSKESFQHWLYRQKEFVNLARQFGLIKS